MAQSRFSGESAGELTSIEAMAAAAEELAAGSEAATVPERDLEPPAWVMCEPDETPEPEPAASSIPSSWPTVPSRSSPPHATSQAARPSVACDRERSIGVD